jgi:hypothetical protein
MSGVLGSRCHGCTVCSPDVAGRYLPSADVMVTLTVDGASQQVRIITVVVVNSLVFVGHLLLVLPACSSSAAMASRSSRACFAIRLNQSSFSASNAKHKFIICSVLRFHCMRILNDSTCDPSLIIRVSNAKHPCPKLRGLVDSSSKFLARMVF